ncbi:DAD/Ost2 [Trinorchestia longiramus]|nr:DAD/Ost2 [Trinorchestia longiramus]
MAYKVAGQKSSSAAAAATSSNASLSLSAVLNNFYVDYQKNTPKKLKMVDAYLLYVVLTGIIQFAYCCLVGTFPFNSFLSGFISTVGCFVLGVCMRLQANPQNKHEFESISPERGFADFIFAHVILHLVIVNFIG